MKRLLRGFIFVFIAILSFTLISCGNEETPHEHTPSATWTRDSSGHWHDCEECGSMLEFTKHTMTEYTKVENECKEESSCSVCGFETSRTISHEFVDGLCTGCGLEEGNYEVDQFYVRGEHNSWGSPEEDALVYDPKTKTASITITLEEGKKFKVADANWTDGLNFGFANSTFEEGLFEAAGEDIIVLQTAEYIITVSGYDTGEYAVEIKVACLHEFGPETAVSGKECEFTQTCTKCNTVNQYTKHTFTDADIICDVCGHADLKVYYVKGSFNNFEVNEEFVLEYDETTHTATVNLWLQVGHSFKIGTADGTDEEKWKFGYDANALTESAKDAFIADGDANYYCVAKGENALGVKFTVTITGLNTLNHTMTIDTEEEYSVESVDIPSASSGLFVLGTMNGWGANDSYGLSTKDGKSTITLTLTAGDEFKIAKADYSTEFNFNTTTFATGLFTAGGEYGNNLTVVTSGTYTIVVVGNTCTIVAGENTDDIVLPDPVDENAWYLRGTMNSWTPKSDYKFTKTDNTSTLEVELTAGDKFKITLGSSWADTDQFNFKSITTGANLFTADTENPDAPNIVVNATGTYLFKVTGTTLTVELVEENGGNDDTNTPVNPDQGGDDTGTTENPDQSGDNDDTTENPTPVKSDLYILGGFNGWVANDDAKLIIEGQNKVYTVKLYAGCEFKVRKGETWDDVQYYYVSTMDSTLVEAGEGNDKPNIKVKAAGEYKITVTGTTLSIAKIGEYTCVSTTEHTMANATCTLPKHCSVTGCGYQEGVALGHTWNDGVQNGDKIVYTCTTLGCGETKEENATGITLYLKPNNNWKADSAWFAVYYWGTGVDAQWAKMTDSDGDGIYEATIKTEFENVIFCRMNSSKTTLDWGSKWDQTVDLSYTDGYNLCTIPEGAWNNANGNWSKKQ